MKIKPRGTEDDISGLGDALAFSDPIAEASSLDYEYDPVSIAVYAELEVPLFIPKDMMRQDGIKTFAIYRHSMHSP
ncbi:hypothetical protein D3C78_1440490 [compost metagenome]